jgi:hypothetical protein
VTRLVAEKGFEPPAEVRTRKAELVGDFNLGRIADVPQLFNSFGAMIGQGHWYGLGDVKTAMKYQHLELEIVRAALEQGSEAKEASA